MSTATSKTPPLTPAVAAVYEKVRVLCVDRGSAWSGDGHGLGARVDRDRLLGWLGRGVGGVAGPVGVDHAAPSSDTNTLLAPAAPYAIVPMQSAWPTHASLEQDATHTKEAPR